MTPASSGRPQRVLIIEDYEDTARMLTALVKSRGYEVRAEYTGPDGLRAAEDYHPEVILSDIGLPGIDGYTIARELRKRPEFTETLMVAVTGYNQESDRRQAVEAGFDYHLPKPLDVSQLFEILLTKQPSDG